MYMPTFLIYLCQSSQHTEHRSQNSLSIADYKDDLLPLITSADYKDNLLPPITSADYKEKIITDYQW